MGKTNIHSQRGTTEINLCHQKDKIQPSLATNQAPHRDHKPVNTVNILIPFINSDRIFFSFNLHFDRLREHDIFFVRRVGPINN